MSFESEVISVSGLAKAYRTYHRRLDRLLEWICPWDIKRHDLKWVIKDVSFKVKKGESLGIIGQNGAGKSTLLKLLTGTIRATKGEFAVNGSVAALLELGMGFHGDFTGRQNVYMAGHILGYSRQQIDAVIHEIEEFAEIGSYFDEPVRVYSSGMQVRLAFSLATAYRPDILIVDEALAVGDAYFQHKCFARIKSFRESGTSLLFVSHDPAAVKSLCDRAILLRDGCVAMDASPIEVLDLYNALIAEKENSKTRVETDENGKSTVRSGNGLASIEKVTLAGKYSPQHIFQCGDSMSINLEIRLTEQLDNITLGILIRDRLGNDVYGTNTWHQQEQKICWKPGGNTISIMLDNLLLGQGSYSVTIALHDYFDHIAGNYDWWDRAATFEVVRGSGADFIGICNLDAKFEMRDLV